MWRFLKSIVAEAVPVGYEFSGSAIGFNAQRTYWDAVEIKPLQEPTDEQRAMLTTIAKALGVPDEPAWLLCAHYG